QVTAAVVFLFQFELIERHVPMRVEYLESALLFFEESLPIRVQLSLNLVLARRCGHRRRVLEHYLHSEGPIGAAVAVICRHERFHARDSSGLDLLAEHRQMVPREERLELFLEAPFHAVEIPYRSLRVGGALRRGRLRVSNGRQEQHYRQQNLSHGFTSSP